MAGNFYFTWWILILASRWHSDAFKVYIDTPREVRARLAEELAGKVAASMQLG